MIPHRLSQQLVAQLTHRTRWYFLFFEVKQRIEDGYMFFISSVKPAGLWLNMYNRFPFNHNCTQGMIRKYQICQVNASSDRCWARFASKAKLYNIIQKQIQARYTQTLGQTQIILHTSTKRIIKRFTIFQLAKLGLNCLPP